MAELNLGNKYECYNCGTRFYDLGKSEPLCPKCGANQKDSNRGESSSATPAARRKRKVDTPKPVEVEDDVPVDDLPEDALPEGEIEADLAGDEVEEEEEVEDEA
jgi:uncharacterized protein (TIGR02300 family)